VTGDSVTPLTIEPTFDLKNIGTTATRCCPNAVRRNVSTCVLCSVGQLPVRAADDSDYRDSYDDQHMCQSHNSNFTTTAHTCSRRNAEADTDAGRLCGGVQCYHQQRTTVLFCFSLYTRMDVFFVFSSFPCMRALVAMVRLSIAYLGLRSFRTITDERMISNCRCWQTRGVRYRRRSVLQLAWYVEFFSHFAYA
jgi:hypothetical protein